MKTKSVLFAFLAAVTAGLFVPALSAEPEAGAKPKGPPGAGRMIEELKTELGLTDAQVEQLRPILKKHMEAIKALRDDESLGREQKHAKMQELRKELLAELAKVLTPEQLAKFEEMRKNRKGPGGPGGEGGERKGPPPPPEEEK